MHLLKLLSALSLFAQQPTPNSGEPPPQTAESPSLAQRLRSRPGPRRPPPNEAPPSSEEEPLSPLHQQFKREKEKAIKDAPYTVTPLETTTFPNSSRPLKPYASNSPGQQTSEFSAANEQAIDWIALLDQHQYASSWSASAGLLQDIVSRQQWNLAMEAQRKGLGPVTARTVSSHQKASQLPHGTRGNFMIIKYNTSFQNSPNRVEQITLMTEGRLGQWRTVAYKITGS